MVTKMMNVTVLVGRMKLRPFATAPTIKQATHVRFLPKCLTSVGMARMATTDVPIMMPLTMGCNAMLPRLYWQKYTIMVLLVFMAEMVNSVSRITAPRFLLVKTTLKYVLNALDFLPAFPAAFSSACRSIRICSRVPKKQMANPAMPHSPMTTAAIV